MTGPIPCVKTGEDPEQRPGCGEPIALRGTSTYCRTCGGWTGITTVSFDPETDWEAVEEAWRKEDEGTPLEWIHVGQTDEKKETHP